MFEQNQLEVWQIAQTLQSHAAGLGERRAGRSRLIPAGGEIGQWTCAAESAIQGRSNGNEASIGELPFARDWAGGLRWLQP